MKRMYVLLVIGLVFACISIFLFMQGMHDQSMNSARIVTMFCCDGAAFACAGIVMHELKGE